jgi:uncharacterized protein DUF4254
MHDNEKTQDMAALPNSKELVPVLWHVIDRWHQAEADIQDWRDAEATIFTEHKGWAGMAEFLQLINTYQWHEEDKSRAHEAGDEIQAAVKRSIDTSNSRRVQQIEKLDAMIFELLAEHDLPLPGAPLHSESPASIVDRITVLALKLYHIREELSTAGGTLDEAFLHARIENLDEQVKDLAGCLDDLFLDIAAGRRSIKLYRQVKVYKDPETGRYHSGLSAD